MTHYVCVGGCKGVSDNPQATCQAEDCPKHTHPLIACECTDGEHAQAYDAAGNQSSEGETPQA